MKKWLLMLLVLLGNLSMVHAQKLQEVVYLKNGSIIKGVIIEQVLGSSLKIQTADGSVFAYKMSEVEKITKEIASKRYNNKYAQEKENIATSYRGFFDIGYTVGVGDYGEGRLEFMTSHGYQFLPYFYLGAGAGIHYFHESAAVGIPLFVNMRANMLNNRITPYIDFKVGYSLVDTQGLYLSPTVGIRAGSPQLAFNFGLGYVFQKAPVSTLYYNMTIYGTNYYYYTENENVGGFSIKLGLEF